MGLPLIWEPWACSNVQSIGNSLCHEILPCRIGTTRYPRGVSPHQPAEHQEQHRQHHLKSCPPFNRARMGLYCLFEVIKSSTALKPIKQRKSTLRFMRFNSLAAIRPAGPVPGIENFYLEVGRKILFNTIFNATVFLFPFWVKLEKFLEYWNLEKATVIQQGSPRSHILPQAAPRPLPQNDKHTVEVRGTITAHGYSDKEISTLLRLKHTNKPAPRAW